MRLNPRFAALDNLLLPARPSPAESTFEGVEGKAVLPLVLLSDRATALAVKESLLRGPLDSMGSAAAGAGAGAPIVNRRTVLFEYEKSAVLATSA